MSTTTGSLQTLFNDSENKSNRNSKISTSGKILLGITGGIGIGLTIVCTSFVTPAFRKYCLPYVPATTTQIENILLGLQRCSNNNNVKNYKLLDIGSGDGRVVVAAAKKGYVSHGVELNPWLVQFSKWSAFRNGVYRQTTFFKKDLWKFNVTPYQMIIIFGVEQMMNDLEIKLVNELEVNSYIIACRFPLPNLKACQIIGGGIDTIWIYKILK